MPRAALRRHRYLILLAGALLAGCAAPVGDGGDPIGATLGKADGAEETLAFAHADRGPLPLVLELNPTIEVLDSGIGRLRIWAKLDSCVRSVRGAAASVASSSKWSETAAFHPLVQHSQLLAFDELETIAVSPADPWHRIVLRGLVEYDPSCVSHETDRLSRVVHQAVLIRREGDALWTYGTVLGTGQRCVSNLQITDVSSTGLSITAKPSGECRVAHSAGETLEVEISAVDSIATTGNGVLTFDGETFAGTVEGTDLMATDSLYVHLRGREDHARPVVETLQVSVAAGAANSLSVQGQLEVCASASEGYSFASLTADEREVGAVSSISIDDGEGWAVVEPGTVRDGRRWNRVYCGNAPTEVKVRIRTALGHEIETTLSAVDNPELCGTFTSCEPTSVPEE